MDGTVGTEVLEREVDVSRQTCSDSFAAAVEEIRSRWVTNVFLVTRLADPARRRLGIAPMGTGAAALAGLMGAGVRLLIALTLTAMVGDWGQVPWWRWAVIVAVLGAGDAVAIRRHAPPDMAPAELRRLLASRSGPGRLLEHASALLATMTRESDLRRLSAFTRRWYRLRVSGPSAAGVALVILLTCRLVAPGELSGLPIGTAALLALMLYDLGELTFWNLFSSFFLLRQARYPHDLFWASPVDSPQVRDQMRAWAGFAGVIGVVVTEYLVLAAALVSLGSPLVPPLAAGIVVTGYVTSFASTAALRSGVRKIVEGVRDRHLSLLQDRIETFGPRVGDLSTGEVEEVRHLIELHHTIRGAPTSPGAGQTLVHALAGLIVPTLVFVVTVFGEVYAERLLDRILP